MKKLLILFLITFSIGVEANSGEITQMLSTYNANQVRFYRQYRNSKLYGERTVSGICSNVFVTGIFIL